MNNTDELTLDSIHASLRSGGWLNDDELNPDGATA